MFRKSGLPITWLSILTYRRKKRVFAAASPVIMDYDSFSTRCNQGVD